MLQRLGYRAPATPVPLPGAADPARVAAELDLEPAIARNLARTYGSLAHEVLAVSDDVRPLVDGAPEIVAQVVYAREREWAVDADDVLRRRTTLALRGLASADVRARSRPCWRDRRRPRDRARRRTPRRVDDCAREHDRGVREGDRGRRRHDRVRRPLDARRRSDRVPRRDPRMDAPGAVRPAAVGAAFARAGRRDVRRPDRARRRVEGAWVRSRGAAHRGAGGARRDVVPAGRRRRGEAAPSRRARRTAPGWPTPRCRR